MKDSRTFLKTPTDFVCSRNEGKRAHPSETHPFQVVAYSSSPEEHKLDKVSDPCQQPMKRNKTVSSQATILTRTTKGATQQLDDEFVQGSYVGLTESRSAIEQTRASIWTDG